MTAPDPAPLPAWAEALLPRATDASPRPGLPREDDTEPSPLVGTATATPTAMTPVTSSNIAAVGHDGTSLWIQFKNATLYRYPTAGADLHAAMVAAKSPGQYFHEHIKSKHKGKRL